MPPRDTQTSDPCFTGGLPQADEHRLQLIVQPIIKSTVGQRDPSGKTLDFVANGATFDAITHKLWLKFSDRVNGVATKQDDTWSIAPPTEHACNHVMQFKWNRHLVPTLKSEQAWNFWVVSLRVETVMLLIYEYGLGIPNARVDEEVLRASVRPENIGATAESSARDVVEKLQDIWGRTSQGTTATWPMWANAITRNLNRYTWDSAILDPPIRPILAQS
ncbi:unnamed protein product [Phytophthora fragariaefolia]|uniref:Unnamed protein product n=1 Tax=Phytophthora fragariaefolia TaxID=1490495 RepID=A0A9W7CRS0_9STRA|nr:unnamed protein product [Phytophthora fragariaefolia]